MQEKNNQVNTSSDRNPLLHSIVESDLLSASGSVPLVVPNVAGVGEMKLFEKELLNLPSFQLSDSQNPLLPSPTCLNEDFPTQFDSNNGVPKSKTNDQDRKTISAISSSALRRFFF